MPVTEFSLIERYFSDLGVGDGVALSVGDDCALMQPGVGEQVAVSVDTVVSGVHFPTDASPDDIAFRAVATALSDLAAMGARPLGMTLAITLPEADEKFLALFAQGLASAVTQFDAPLVGGDTTQGPLTISVQVLGAVAVGTALTRSGAQVGEQLCVSGVLGDAAAALAHLSGEWQAPSPYIEYLQARFYRPTPRLELGTSLIGSASAAIDISDGLLADAAHIARRSGVRLEIDTAQLPLSEALMSCKDKEQRQRWALSGGDDYELCFTLPAELPVPAGCACIGAVVAGEGVHCGRDVDFRAGYAHFSS